RSYRNVFNFTDAITHYKKAMEKVGGEEFNKIKSELEEIEKLEKFDTTTQHSIKENLDYYILLLEELCRNIENKYEQGEYVDFIARLFRFNEAFLRCIIEMETNIQTNNEEELKKYINEENLSKYFEERKIEIRRSTIVYKKIIEHLLKKKEKKDFLGKANDFIKKIDSINDIRNNSIAAHGFRGVAKKDLVEKGTPEPAEIKKLLELLKEEYLKKEHC
ncbi:MAG: hypothetical protein N3G76_01920, partial [Candidatus Micrarchaeota archaeon]|nr:hypothetical protein [Candidatus Micrarchaeota archaeon]